MQMVDLRQGDCLELMKNIPDGSIDMILTDPPYGIDYQSARRTDKTKWKPKILNDKTPFLSFISDLKRILKPSASAMVFTRWDVQQSFIDEMNANGLRVRNVLIWDKKSHSMGDLKRSYGSRYESILFHSGDSFRFPGKRPQDILSFSRVPANRLLHPNEKPVQLLTTLIEQVSEKGGIVFDPFMGAGSTGVACVKTGRNFIGMELDEHYFQVASERIRQAEACGVQQALEL